ncbi:hypothetical protein SAMN04489726_1476 [Allokutzneria albata]|uniref:Uncharacterized protein n=1 Tax=Allokutzneria albata TaxID=211114 RepID=A0A1G9T005_ALLAB|nr:hypothetical protein SAMN04489726_1476 [Allokutzneria albata]
MFWFNNSYSPAMLHRGQSSVAIPATEDGGHRRNHLDSTQVFGAQSATQIRYWSFLK